MRRPLYILSGGGTGGHITPLLAVATELRAQQPNAYIVYVGERGSKFAAITKGHPALDASYAIWAGKFRRYHGDSVLRKLLDVRTNFFNIRDLFYFAIGTVQSWLLLRRLRPTAVLLKGGFVGVPVGLAASVWGVPFMTHDSDAIPGLANRIVSRWARVHAVAMPADQYRYPKDRTIQVGVLTEPQYQRVDAAQQRAYKRELALPENAPVLLVTGGSSGAVRLNEAVASLVSQLFVDYPQLHIVHQVGKGKGGVYVDRSYERLHIYEFLRPMHMYTGAADVVVSRASANTMAELGTQEKPVIAVPSPVLANGHQLRNAEALAAAHAAIVVPENTRHVDRDMLNTAIHTLLDDESQRRQLASALHARIIPDAAQRVARLLIELS